MPVPIPGLKVRSDKQKVKFLTIFGGPKNGIFREFRGVPGRAPLVINHADTAAAPGGIAWAGASPEHRWFLPSLTLIQCFKELGRLTPSHPPHCCVVGS